MAKRKRPKSTVSTIICGYSGVRSGEVDSLVRDLRERGARNINVQPDPDTDRDFPDDTHYIVDYTK